MSSWEQPNIFSTNHPIYGDLIHLSTLSFWEMRGLGRETILVHEIEVLLSDDANTLAHSLENSIQMLLLLQYKANCGNLTF